MMGRSTQAQLDDVERQIVAALQHDGRITTHALAKRVGVSEVTARRKLRRLLGEGIVQVVGAVNPFQVGFDSPALVGVKVDRNRFDEVAEALCSHPAVRYVVAATGTFHFFVEVMAPDNHELADLLLNDIGSIPGVIDTETALILRIYKQTWDWRVLDEQAPPTAGAEARAGGDGT